MEKIIILLVVHFGVGRIKTEGRCRPEYTAMYQQALGINISEVGLKNKHKLFF